jgi:enoyl-CoA hydratase/carnithine racemase
MHSDIHLEYRDNGRTAIVTIDRAHRRNACDFQAWTDLRDVFLGFAQDVSLRLVILTGAGGHFCAGDDIHAFRELQNDPVRADTYRERIQECYAAVQATPQPVIAAMSGACAGGGCSLALCCDFRVADGSARVGVPVAKLGLVYPTIQLYRLTHLIGISMTRRWLYQGDFVDCKAAHAAGFIDEVTSGAVVDAALEFGAPMMDNAPLSIAGSKLQLNAIAADTVARDAARIEAIARLADNSEDYKNATLAFAAKRPPTFVGR